MLQVHNVSKAYKGVPVLSGVSFTVSPGERLAVLGPNGAGKTTLLEMIATLLKPDQGFIEGVSRETLGYVPQELALLSKITVREQLKFWAGMAPVKVSKQRVDDLVSLVGLENKLNAKVELLSGGMKRKLNIILSLLHDPELIILDEPTVGIDLESKLEIIEFLKQIGENNQKTVIFTSHDTQEIQQLATKTLFLGCQSF